MENAPLPETITPEEEINEHFEIKKDESIYKLNIEVLNQDITLNLVNEKEIMNEYETKLTFDQLKQIHKRFLILTSCKEFVDYMKALIENNKLSIKNSSENKICIAIMEEYPLNLNTIKIDLIKKKINFDLIAKDLYKKILVLNENFKKLEINYQNIINDNIMIKEESNKIKEEYNNFKEENQRIKKENCSIKKDIKTIKDENNRIKQVIKTIKGENILETDIINLEKKDILENGEKSEESDEIMHKENYKEIKDKKSIPEEQETIPEKNQAFPEHNKDEDIQYKEMTLMEKLQSILVKIFLDKNSDIDIKDINELKKISSAFLIRKKNPIEEVQEFFDANLNNVIYELNDEQKINLANKKAKILFEIGDISIIKTITTKNLDAIIKVFENKYGITEADINYKDFVKEIQLNNFDEIKILKAILKKLKYLMEND